MTSARASKGAYVRGFLLVLVAGVLIAPAFRADAATAPRNAALPVVSGAPYVGRTLTTTTGSWTGQPTPTLTYKWQRCSAAGGSCGDISGASKVTYLLVTADKGKR